MTLAHLSLLLGTSASLLAQQLPRKEAQRIVESVKDFRDASSLSLPRSLQSCGERQGLWTVGTWGLGVGPKGRSFLKEVHYNLLTGNLVVTTIGKHKRTIVAITGISDAEDGLKQADFDFAWEWIDVSPELTRECLTIPASFAKAYALFKHYDDGWRLVTIEITE